VALTSLVLLLVLDQARLQPWVYQYILVLGVLLAYTFQKKEKRSEVYPVLSMIIVFMYLYSGLSKINPTFFNEVSIWMIEPITQQVSVWAQGPFLMVSKGIPFLEIGVAVGLIFKSTRKYAGVILIMIHIFILILIGPLGHDWNSVVWPWNIFSILFILLLFIYNKGLDFRKIISASESLLFKFFFLLVCVLPILSFFNLWDSYLSFNLYSGNVHNGVLLFEEEAKGRLSSNYQDEIPMKPIPGGYMVNIQQWSIEDISVPSNPSVRVYKSIVSQVCSVPGLSLTLLIERRALPFGSKQRHYYQCDEV